MDGKAMEREVREQPALLLAQADGYLAQASEALRGARFDMVLLVARGSSDNAALYARYLIEIVLRMPVSLAAPSVLTRYGAEVRYPPCLVIGVSQSGAGPDVTEVIGRMRASGHPTLAVTNTPGSPLAAAADGTVMLGVGPETSVAATKTYSASLLALYQTVRALGGDLPAPALPGLDWLGQAERFGESQAGRAVGARPLFVLGRGLRYASAHECALKLIECAMVPAKAYSSADFAHGPRALAGRESAAVVFGADSAEAWPGGTLAPAPEPPDAWSAPVWDALSLQWLALCAARTRGLDPDRPERLSKVTKTF